MCYKSPELPVA